MALSTFFCCTVLVSVMTSSLVSQASAQNLSNAAIAYTSKTSACPSDAMLVRSAGSEQTLSSGDSDYVSARKLQVVPQAFSVYLSNVQASINASNITLPDYVSKILSKGNNQPTLGISVSGGGHRAALFGDGIVNALDGRSGTSVQAGTGGLLQAATYLSGLSSGNFFVTSLAQADFPTVPALIFGTSGGFGGWLTQFGLLQTSTDAGFQQQYIMTLLEEIARKRTAGFPVTITDPWTRRLARHFANGTNAQNLLDSSVTHGAGELWSGIRDL
jgi:lysophospholipase